MQNHVIMTKRYTATQIKINHEHYNLDEIPYQVEDS